MKTAKTQTFAIYATFLAHKNKFQELKNVNQQSLDLMKHAPGLIYCQCLEPPTEDKPFVFTALWESQQDFKRFMQSPKTQAFHNRTEIKKLHESCLQQASAEFYALMDHWAPGHSNPQI